MKGYIVLSEGRSGTNWLNSMANATDIMGFCHESLNEEHLTKPRKSYTAESIFEHVIGLGRTKNDRFAIKIFPRHMYWVQEYFGFDFVKKVLETHDCRVIFLRRRDSLGQAISWVRGFQTLQWTSISPKKGDASYDFSEILKAQSHIARSFAFWETYLNMRGIEYHEYYYEDLLNGPNDYLEDIAEHLEVKNDKGWVSGLQVQRDRDTDIWRERFLEDIEDLNSLPFQKSKQRTPRTLWNFAKLLANQHFTYHW